MSGILLLLLSFPSVVIGNLFLPWLFSYRTTDTRTLRAAKTLGDDANSIVWGGRTVFCMGQDKCAKIGGAEYQICRYGSAQTPCYKLPN